MLTTKLTASGLDFLEADGGLSAILNVVIVRLEADTLRQLIEAKVAASDMSESAKQTVLAKIRSVSEDVLKGLVVELTARALDRPEILSLLLGLLNRG